MFKLVLVSYFISSAFICGSFGIPSCVTKDSSGDVFDFNIFRGKEAGIVSNVNNLGQTSFILTFCTEIESVIGDFTVKPKNEWFGWKFGEMILFNYTGSQGVSSPSFVQYYSNGDAGYPCVSQRKSTVNIYCGNCPQSSNCENSNNTLCVCSATYEPTLDPCQLTLDLSLKSCPSPAVPPHPFIPTSPKTSNGLTAGQQFGIVLLVFVILGVMAFVGGFFYNIKVKNKKGLNAIPGIDTYKKFTGRSQGYQRTDTKSSYGTTST